MAAAQPPPDFKARLSAVAALELLAAAAPARVVAAELLALGGHPLSGDRAAAPDPGGHRGAVAAREHRPGSTAGRSDRLRAGKRLVLVGERAAVEPLRLLRL